MSDYREERLAIKRNINALNKRRSKTMETRVMRVLSGNRVPMSGSGSIKGDGQIFSKFGYILVECKCSAAILKDQPTILLRDIWLKELEKDGRSMRATFSILVVHFHNTRQDYAIVSAEAFNKYLGTVDVCSLPNENVKQKKTWRLIKNYMDKVIVDHDSLMRITMPHGEYLLMRLEYIKELLEDTNE